MRATAPSRRQKESARKLGFRVSRLAAAILALVAFLPLDTTAQKPPQPLILMRPTADSRGMPTNTGIRTNLAGTSPVARVRGSPTPMPAGRLGVAHVSPAESERMPRLPAVYQEDTPFSTQARMPVADLWGGRLQFDGFYREISANSMFHGLSQSTGIGWATPQSLTLRSATSYGIQLSFRMSHIRTRTLHRYLLGGGG